MAGGDIPLIAGDAIGRDMAGRAGLENPHAGFLSGAGEAAQIGKRVQMGRLAVQNAALIAIGADQAARLLR